jgi:glycosyltransferase involved in cell wall biosynthesis
MKILILSNSLSSTIRFRKWLLDRLELQGHQIFIVSSEDIKPPISQNSNIQYFNIHLDRKSKSIFNNVKLMYSFFTISKSLKPDLALLYTTKPALLAPIIYFILKIPSISIFTGLGSGFIHISKLKRLLFFLIRATLSFSSAIIVLNRQDKAYLNKVLHIPLKKTYILPGEGIDVNFFMYQQPIPSPVLKFLFIGRLIKDKGIHELLDAFQQLHCSHMGKFRVTIIGSLDSGNPTTISSLDLDNIKNLNYIDYVKHTDSVEKYIRDSDIFILPSYREGLSRSLLESCSIGRPAIVTNVPGLAELVENGINGFVCAPQDSEQLYVLMKKVINTDRLDLLKMGMESRRKVVGCYDVDSVYNKFIKILNTTLKYKAFK